ncbi:PA14 domain-containing protein [Flavobacterium sp. W22_SRS_FP1]|uniref:PA14 domain-containing protein n=1 Tax=Flavobacterium sp. W22_SRS_FP1 TaxID=3240276 RepID=UPI003F930AD7
MKKNYPTNALFCISRTTNLFLFICVMLVGTISFGQIAQRGDATTAAGTNSNLTISKPEGIAVGDLMLANFSESDNNSNLSVNVSSIGWTLIAGGNLGDNRMRGTVLYKIAVSADVLVTEYNFTLNSGTNSSSGAIIAFSGVDKLSPFDVTPGTINTDDSRTVTATSITTISANAAIVMLGQVGNNRSYSNWNTNTSPGTLTELFDVENNNGQDTSVGGSWAIKTTPGATGEGTANLSNNNDERNGGILLALRSYIDRNTSTKTFTSSGTFTVPSCVTSLTIQAWGGGASGGAKNRDARGGGGGGGYVTNTYAVSEGDKIDFTVGVGGIITDAKQKPGVNGGDSSYNYLSLVTAGGGTITDEDKGGTGGPISGAYGAGSKSGGNGSDRVGNKDNEGGGGGGSGATASNANKQTGGALGGGDGGNKKSAGNNGTAPGGGGGGKGGEISEENQSGNGANGQVIITYIVSGPSNYSVTGGGSYCAGGAGVAVGLANSHNGVNYQLYNGTSTVGSAFSGTGSAISFGNQIAAGTYTVKATNGGCTADMTGNAVVTVNAAITAPIVGTITQPTCTVGTGSVVLNGMPPEWALTQYPGGITTTGTGTSTTISGLYPGKYTYSVIGANNGTGLKGEYFNSTSSITSASNPTFPTTSPTLTRTDATVAFDWERVNPAAPIGTDNFFVRWSGQVQPLYSESYTFTTRSDDGVRLRVNGVPIINDWNIYPVKDNTGTISLTAGVKYDIVLEYYENAGEAVSKLFWNSTSQAKEIIPQSQLFPSAICGSPASEDVVIDAQPVTPAPPTPETPTQPDCITPTGSVVLTKLPSGNWTINPGGISGNGSSITINGLTEDTYNFTVTNDSGCTSDATSNIKIKAATVITNTWSNGSWDKGLTTTDQKIVFTDNYNEDADVNGCSCLVTGSKEVTIKAGKTMKIVNDLEVRGTLIFENNASLVQINDNASNSGSIIYNRTTPEILKTDYVYWSSPVNGAALKAIQTGTLYYSFNGSGNSWANANANTIMNTGKGYIVRGAGTWFDTGNVTLTANFVGVPNNGVIPVSIVASKNNLIGNPYPSAIDGNAFLEANTDVLEGPTDVLEGTLYFWTHKSAIQLASGIDPGKAGSGAYAYTSDDYTPFTKVGGTNSVTGSIAAGQSFFARGSTIGGQAKFVNSMRLDGDKILDNSVFLKPASASKTEKTTSTNKIEKSRIWLNLTNTQGAFKQMLLGYMTGATNNYDRGYDALSFNGNSFINFYSINNTSRLTIEGRALPIQETDTVPLGYSSTIVGDFSISIDKTDGALSTMDVFLEDKLTNTAHNLKKGAYTFTTEKGTFNDRFVLSYANRTLEVIDNIDEKKFGVLIYNKNKEIVIKSSEEIIDKVLIYDFLGKQVFSNKNVNETDLKVSDLILINNQALIVKVILQNGEIITKKIIL